VGKGEGGREEGKEREGRSAHIQLIIYILYVNI